MTIRWNYDGYDTSGTLRRGMVRAGDAAQAREAVRAQGVTATRLVKSQDIVMPWENRAPGLKDRALFTHQFAQLLGGGVPLRAAIGIAARTVTNHKLKAAVEKVRREIESGEPIDEVFARKEFESTFDPVFVAFVRMGSESGGLSGPLMELSEMYRWQLKITGMVKKGLTLPAIIGLVCVIVTYFIMARVVPTFMGILDGLKAELPPLTRMVQQVSQLASSPLVTGLLVLGVVGLLLAVRQARRSPAGQYRYDRALLRLPIVGPLLRTFILARVSKGVAVMLRNQIPLDQTLAIASTLAANEVYRRHFLEMRGQTIIGERMFPVMARSPKDFPEAYWAQFQVAEEQGTLTTSLAYLGGMYDDEVTALVEGLTAAVEPLLMIFLGGVVGIVVISVFLPMATMIDALQK